MNTARNVFATVVALACAAPELVSARPAVLELSPGRGGPTDDQGGAGNEQPTVATTVKDGKTWLTTVFMNSDVDKRPWQCKCSAVMIDPVTGPQLVADQVLLTNLDGDRPCNHPKIAADDSGTILFSYGSDDPDQANVQTYVQALDAQCNKLSNPLRISNIADNNEGAPDIAWNGGSTWTSGYLSNGERTYAVGLSVTGSGTPSVGIEVTWRTVVVDPANIGRPSIQATGPNRSIVCAAKGDNRPPEDGVECAMLDTTSGVILWKELIAPSDPENDIYMNQPTLAAFGDEGKVAMLAIQSMGGGGSSDRKGTSLSQLYLLDPDDTGAHMMNRTTGLGEYQAHATLCSGAYGEGGEPHLGVFDASITGGGLAMLTTASVDPATGLLVRREQDLASGNNGDSGYIANIYGQNPGTQGREFLRCIGDVPNPGYGVQGGYQSTVKSFFALPHTGRKKGEPKNALFLSLVAGGRDAIGSPAATPTPPSGSDPGGEPPPPPVGARSGTVHGRAACSVGGLDSATAPALISLAILGLFTVGAISRRRSER